MPILLFLNAAAGSGSTPEYLTARDEEEVEAGARWRGGGRLEEQGHGNLLGGHTWSYRSSAPAPGTALSKLGTVTFSYLHLYPCF